MMDRDKPIRMIPTRHVGKTIDALIKLKAEALDLGKSFSYVTHGKIHCYVLIEQLEAEKHRADVAEEALRLACKEINSESKVCGKVDCEFVTCHSDKCTYILTSHLKQQAAERLKELQGEK